MFQPKAAPRIEILTALDAAGVAAAVWSPEGQIIACTAALGAYAGRAPEAAGDLVAQPPADWGAWVGAEHECRLGGSGRAVSVRVAPVAAGFLGIFTDQQERARLSDELNRKTADLEEKVWELSRSKRAILNILEDLEERSRELSKGKEELEVLNENLQRFNRDLERANRELRTLDEVKSNLLSNVSHELRTPLVAIKGYNELIYREKLGPLTEKQRSGLEISLKSLARLIDLINNLLDFSRIEIGKLQLEVDRFSVSEIANEVLGIITPRAAERGIEIAVEIPPDDVFFVGDRNKVAQVLTNLLTNAVKFNKDHGRIVLGVDERDGEVVFRIGDSGIGIAPEHVGRIFDRFFQIDSSMTRRQGGTGIGLSIVKSLVELHGGSIQVVSTPGEGSTFFVRLPQRKLPPAA